LEVTGERSDERRHLPVALEPAEAAFRVEHPGRTPAFDHLAVAPPLHVLVVSRAIEIMLSMQFVFVRLAASRPPTPSRRPVNLSSRPSRRLAAPSGQRAGNPA
jgi:hypothetical protein